jgi:hypothetical protein
LNRILHFYPRDFIISAFISVFIFNRMLHLYLCNIIFALISLFILNRIFQVYPRDIIIFASVSVFIMNRMIYLYPRDTSYNHFRVDFRIRLEQDVSDMST